MLLLDEPTNHMDIIGKESLENILKEYEGTLIFVSHDRYFVNKIADSILAFEPSGVIYFNGNYEQYCEYKESKMTDENFKENETNTKKKSTNNQYVQNKENTKRINKMNKIEKEIEQKEEKIRELRIQMESENICTDFVKLKEIQDEIEKIEQEIEMKMMEWEKLCM